MGAVRGSPIARSAAAAVISGLPIRSGSRDEGLDEVPSPDEVTRGWTWFRAPTRSGRAGRGSSGVGHVDDPDR